LTNDIHHDRSPQWSPDGNRLAFYSDRSGRFEIWLINADGTGLRQLTHTSGQSAVYPFWSPDGSRIVYKQRDAQPYVIEVDKPWHEQTPQKLPSREGQGDNFWSFAWSPDGHKLAGVWFLGPDKQSFLHAYDFNTKRFENYGVTGSRPTWLSDNRRLLYTKENSLWMFDTHTRQNTEILNTGLHAIGAVCPTTDNRAIYYSLQKTESGVWLLTHE
jgi:Tol biopolymer transport system component